MGFSVFNRHLTERLSDLLNVATATKMIWFRLAEFEREAYIHSARMVWERQVDATPEDAAVRISCFVFTPVAKVSNHALHLSSLKFICFLVGRTSLKPVE